MIDNLKSGQIAESKDGWMARWGDYHRLLLSSKKTGSGRQSIFRSDIERKWRIIPNYVSFVEAMNALKDGYTVRCYPENDGGYIEFNEADSIKSVAESWTGLSWSEFLASKWTILEDDL